MILFANFRDDNKGFVSISFPSEWEKRHCSYSQTPPPPPHPTPQPRKSKKLSSSLPAPYSW